MQIAYHRKTLFSTMSVAGSSLFVDRLKIEKVRWPY